LQATGTVAPGRPWVGRVPGRGRAGLPWRGPPTGPMPSKGGQGHSSSSSRCLRRRFRTRVSIGLPMAWAGAIEPYGVGGGVMAEATIAGAGGPEEVATRRIGPRHLALRKAFGDRHVAGEQVALLPARAGGPSRQVA